MNAHWPLVAQQALCAPGDRERPIFTARQRSFRRSRSGAAVVELAVLAPLLVMLFIIAVDFARVYYYSLTLTNCAAPARFTPATRGPKASRRSTAPQTRRLSEASNLTPAPTITERNGANGSGQAWVEVEAEHTFSTITGFPGIPNEVRLRRSVRMFVSAITPDT